MVPLFRTRDRPSVAAIRQFDWGNYTDCDIARRANPAEIRRLSFALLCGRTR